MDKTIKATPIIKSENPTIGTYQGYEYQTTEYCVFYFFKSIRNP